MCWYLGRQGSSGNGSWENTESSPEEQELRVSGKLGEYCSVGVHRSRYSWKKRDSWMRYCTQLENRKVRKMWWSGSSVKNKIIILKSGPPKKSKILKESDLERASDVESYFLAINILKYQKHPSFISIYFHVCSAYSVYNRMNTCLPFQSILISFCLWES